MALIAPLPEKLAPAVQFNENDAQRCPGGDEAATYVYSQPSGFTAFEIYGLGDGSQIFSYDHGGNQLSVQPLATYSIQNPPRPPPASTPRAAPPRCAASWTRRRDSSPSTGGSTRRAMSKWPT